MITLELYDKFLKHQEETSKNLIEKISSGTLEDFHQYHKYCGMLEGIRMSTEELKDIVETAKKKSNSEFDYY